jgi:hypothetical protein
MKSIDQTSLIPPSTVSAAGLTPDQPLARFDAQIQLQFLVDPVNFFVVPAEPLHVAQIQGT